jgi:V8-like Glu-specific endopeptidase
MHRRIAIRTAVVVCAVSASIPVGLAGSRAATASSVVAHVFHTEEATVRSFWTRTRMEAATPLTPGSATLSSIQATPPTGSEGTSMRIEPTPPADIEPSAPPSANAVRFVGFVPYTRSEIPNPSAFPYRTAGKLFGVSENGKPFDCSATAVSSANKSVVWTAAHCVYDDQSGGWSRALEFVPGYKDGAAPYGEWPVIASRVPPAWIRTGSHDHDMAALVVSASEAGRYRVDVVGGRGLLVGQPRQQSFDTFGYPSDPPFDGERLHVCASAYGGEDPVQADIMAIGCDMTSGSSGGGWIIGDRYLNSVTSYGYTHQPELLYGPYFGATAGSLHQSASVMEVPHQPKGSQAAVLGVRHHAVRLSLRLAGHLTASGKMTAADGYLPCSRNARVTILRTTGSGWTVVGRTRTGDAGRYRVGVPDVAGTYRAFSPHGSVNKQNRCAEVTSGTRIRA